MKPKIEPTEDVTLPTIVVDGDTVTPVSALLEWVAKHKKPWPAPPGFDLDTIHQDLHEDAGEFTGMVNETEFITITKKDFAKRLGKAQAQVSRWIAAGMPITEDGTRLPWGRALRWLDRYQEQCERRKSDGWK